jgi:ubiquinone/menaquinone biosynthesis C-methylase UbiE
MDRLRLAVGPRVFEALYGTAAPLYDQVSTFFFAGQWSVWQLNALTYIKGSRVLELGYGTGDLALEMCRRGYEVTGVESSPRMHRIARAKLRRAGCRANLLVGSSSALPLGDECIDAVVSTFPSGYILWDQTWGEVHRVLRTGGTFAIVLSGELLPVSHRSKLLIRFHEMVYGKRDTNANIVWPDVPGFDTAYERHANEQGIASLLVARKRS